MCFTVRLTTLALAGVLALAGAPVLVAQDVTKAFSTTDGVCYETASATLICTLSGSTDPSLSSGVAAPVGSVYHSTNGITYKKTSAPDTGWVVMGLESPVVSQTADFGKNGVASANSWLNRAGSVPSNLVGIPITVESGTIQSIYCANTNTVSGNVLIYEHDGTTFTLKYTLAFSSSLTASASGLSISIIKGKMIGVQTEVSLANPGCTVAMKGTSL